MLNRLEIRSSDLVVRVTTIRLSISCPNICFTFASTVCATHSISSGHAIKYKYFMVVMCIYIWERHSARPLSFDYKAGGQWSRLLMAREAFFTLSRSESV